MNLYKVQGGCGPNFWHYLIIRADTRKEAIIKYMDLADETYHENLSAEKICEFESIVNNNK